MKITLIRPPKLVVSGSIGTGASVSSSSQPTAPLGIALIAAMIASEGHEILVIDGTAENPSSVNDVQISLSKSKLSKGLGFQTFGLSPQEVLDRIPVDTDVIGFSCMFTHNWLADRELINFLASKLPKATFIAGGESITGMAEICLKQIPALKVCVLGEGEETIVELLNSFKEGTSLDSVNGIMYKSDAGDFIKTEKRKRIRQLDDLPLPAWDLLPVDNYEKQGRFSGDVPRVSLPILSTRGCPYTCTFCTSPDMWGTRYFMRSPKHVADEMEMMKSKYNVTNFEFYDLTAIVQRKWIIELSKIIIERKLDIYWRIPSGTRSEAIDGEVAFFLLNSGCYTITYAPESGSHRLLELIHKKVYLPTMLKSMKAAAGQGMKLYINMIQGLPQENHSDIWKTLWFLVQCAKVGVDELSLGTFRPYPGTVLFNELVNSKKINLDNDDYFLETLLTIETEESFYNENVHPSFYRFYNKLMLFVFYTSVYIFRPKKFVKALVNISNNTSDSRFERTVLFYINQTKQKMAAIF